jgi:hypothetical protein
MSKLPLMSPESVRVVVLTVPTAGSPGRHRTLRSTSSNRNSKTTWVSAATWALGVEDEDRIPVIRTELEVPRAHLAGAGAGGLRIESQVPFEAEDLGWEDAAERQAEARPDDLHDEGRARRRPRGDRGHGSVWTVGDDGDDDHEQQREEDPRRLHSVFALAVCLV